LKYEVNNNMKSKQKKTALVTGGSSGIGRCTASALSQSGYTVYEFSRRDIPIKGVKHMSVDVTDEASVQAAVEQILRERGSIDILVNCAGFGISGAVEFTELKQAKAQFDVNFFGTVNVSRAVLPSMRRHRGGHIVNISSVAAVAHIPFQAFYSASKAAVSSYSCALDNEVSPYGVRVTAVELGDIHTGFTQARQKTASGDDEYGGRISRSVSQMEKDELSGMPPEVVGTYIARIAQKKNCAPICVVGTKYKILSFLCKILPGTLRGKIVDFIYAK
jgi:short-subunit dehydrogenase